VGVVRAGPAAGAGIVVSDLIPAIDGRRLAPRLDDRLAEQLLIDATDGRMPVTLVQ
jgi:predicted metalloprotease with PDZ domain